MNPKGGFLKKIVFHLVTFFSLLLFWGCKEDPFQFDFSHEAHAQYAHQCLACHYSEFEEISKAGHKQCIECHDIDEKKPSKQCLICHKTTENQKPFISTRMDYSNVEFDHDIHLESEISCTKCHNRVEQGKSLKAIQFIPMEGCIKCHFPEALKNLDLNCEFCHYEMNMDVAPESHGTDIWIPTHGNRSKTEKKRCVRCHQDNSCTSCHHSTQPDFHTISFIRRGHGLHAQAQAEKCHVCHQQDFCLSCHQTTSPLYHTPSFKTLRPYIHCGMCHFPIQSGNRCIVCHKSASHDGARADAPPPPDFVDRSLPCLLCHPVERVPVRHLYNTIPDFRCIFCH